MSIHYGRNEQTINVLLHNFNPIIAEQYKQYGQNYTELWLPLSASDCIVISW